MLWLNIDRSANIPLTKQVCEQLRAKILKQELRAGDRLPPTRKFAQDLQVARNVIIYAYEQLAAEGYVESREGSGTYVAEGTALESYRDASRAIFPAMPRRPAPAQDCIDFVIGTPDLQLVPRKIWAKLLRDACLDAPDDAFGYSSSQGLLRLRRTLANFLLKSKGIRCQPDNVIVTAGAMPAFALLARVFACERQTIILEDPSFHQIREIIQSMHLAIVPVPVDERGIRVDALPQDAEAGALIVTPSHHFPLGGVLPIQRRVKLLEYARATHTYLVENDYDSEFRYVGAPISALQLLAPDEVIHVGTFSESLYPALRLGYIILPDGLLPVCREMLSVSGFGVSAIHQLALAAFIEEGFLEGHIAKMKKLYRRKRETLIACLSAAFASRVTISGDATGLYVMAEFRDLEFSRDILERLEKHGVRISPVEDSAIIKGRHRNKIILGYGNLSLNEIETGVKRLQEILA